MLFIRTYDERAEWATPGARRCPPDLRSSPVTVIGAGSDPWLTDSDAQPDAQPQAADMGRARSRVGWSLPNPAHAQVRA